MLVQLLRAVGLGVSLALAFLACLGMAVVWLATTTMGYDMLMNTLMVASFVVLVSILATPIVLFPWKALRK